MQPASPDVGNGNAKSGYESEGVGPERTAELAALPFDVLSAYCTQTLLLACGCRTCRDVLWEEHRVVDLRDAA